MIVRFSGEIGIKGEWTRRAHERLLLKNIKNTLKHYRVDCTEIVAKRGRIYIEADNVERLASRLPTIFGISSISPAKHTTSHIEEIAQTSIEMTSKETKNRSSFAVRCHRVGTHSYSSMDICRKTGEEILTKLRRKHLHVDLTDPQFTINVEVRDADAYVFTQTIRCAGGFPVDSQRKVVCLLSGGIDSPVACWLAMKRGCPIVPVYFDNTPITDEATTAKAIETAKKLFEWSIGYSRRMYIIPHGQNLEIFAKKGPPKLTCILCKRMMYRIAERIATAEGAEGIVTGEAIGEQASQTIVNLRVLNEASKNYPIHRPLLGFDKIETEAIAKKIGTFEISTKKAKGCTAAPKQPATQAKLDVVKKAEDSLPIEAMVETSVQAAKIMTL